VIRFCEGNFLPCLRQLAQDLRILQPRSCPRSWLRRALAEAAWAASHTKDSYLAAQYRRLAARRGKKRALVAVGHSILVIIYHVLKYQVDYQDLGADYFDRLEPERLRRYLVRRLQHLGYDVTLTPSGQNGRAA
jgi:hypothetical protein